MLCEDDLQTEYLLQESLEFIYCLIKKTPRVVTPISFYATVLYKSNVNQTIFQKLLHNKLFI